MTRWKAAGIHLGISLAVAAAVVTFLLLVWYPPPMFSAMGGNHIVLIMIGVDVVLGPLITLVVVTPGKALRLVRMDLAVVGALQLAALGYGVHVIEQGRPAYVVFTVDRFDLVAPVDIRPEEAAKARDERFRHPGWGGPLLVAAKLPADPEEQFRVVQSALQGADLQTFPQHYVPYEQLAGEALRRSRPLEELAKGRPPEDAGEIQSTLAKLGRKAEDTRFLPLKGRAADYCVLLDAKTGAVAGYLKVRPW